MMDKLKMAAELDAIAKKLGTKDYPTFAKLMSMACVLRIGDTVAGSERPDKKYFKYFLKVGLDQRFGERSWDAGYCYEFEDGRVEIWCGPDDDLRAYKYDSMSDTHDWMLD